MDDDSHQIHLHAVINGEMGATSMGKKTQAHPLPFYLNNLQLVSFAWMFNLEVELTSFLPHWFHKENG